MRSSLFTEHSNRGLRRLLETGEEREKDMLVRASQYELERSCCVCLEEGQEGGGSATSEAAALRRTAPPS